MRTAPPVESQMPRLRLTGRLVGRPADRLRAIEARSPVVCLASGNQVGVHVAVIVHVKLEAESGGDCAIRRGSLCMADAGGLECARALLTWFHCVQGSKMTKLVDTLHIKYGWHESKNGAGQCNSKFVARCVMRKSVSVRL